MAGFTPHTDRDEWHGQTVVVRTSGDLTVIGRWDAVVGDEVRMMDAAVHEQSQNDQSADTWVAHLKKFGVPVEQRTFMLPHADVTEIVRLRDA